MFTRESVDRNTALANAVRMEEALAQNRSAATLHQLALACLDLGYVARAETLLEEAQQAAPESAAILADLGAARIKAGDPWKGGETSGQALELDPLHRSATFNWALSLELVSNVPAAIESWQNYLRLDRGSPQATIAERQLSRLQRPRPSWDTDRLLLVGSASNELIRRIATEYPQRARAFAQDELLSRWLESGQAQDLNLLRTIADVRTDAGDPFLSDVVEHAAVPGVELRAGVRLMRQAHASMRAREMRAAAASFERAASHLHKTGSPLAIAAELYAANNAFYDGRSASALARIDRVDAALQKTGSRYPALAAEAAWVRGLTLARMGRSNASLLAYQRALASAKAAREAEHEASLASLIANHLGRIGDLRSAERSLATALRALDEMGAAQSRLYVAYSQIAYLELQAKRPRLALSFVQSQQAIANREEDPLLHAESLAARALALRDLGQRDRATIVLDTARRHAREIKTDGLRDRTLSEIDYIEGTLYSRSHPKLALASLSAAIDTWQRRGWHIRSAVGYLARGDAHLAAGDERAAEQDYRDGIAEMEAEREALDEPAFRVEYFERAGHLFDRLMTLLIDQRRFDDAFAISERKRGRSLLDQLGNDVDAPTPLSLQAVQARLAPDLVLVEYAVLPDRLASWAIRRDTVTFSTVEISRDGFQQEVREFREAILNDNIAAIRTLGRSLHAKLLSPSAGQLEPETTLVLVGDSELWSLPFAALTDEQGRYLVESRAVTMAPSATVYVQPSTGVRPEIDALLSVLQPAPPGMPALRGAAAESAEVSRLYKDARVYRGEDITPPEFLLLASSAANVHFAGHAIVALNDPQESALLFESGLPEPARLTAREIAASKLTSRPLVILAACSTGIGKIRRNEGSDSLASAFLHAGARGVIATLRDIDDELSARLFLRVHQHLQTGISPARAVRLAQLSMIHSPDPSDHTPKSWTIVFMSAAQPEVPQ